MKFSKTCVRKTSLAMLVVLAIFTASAAYGDVTFKVGDATGMIQEADDADGAVNVVTLIPSDGFQVVFELDKLWLRPTEDETVEFGDGVFTDVPLDGGPVGRVAGPTRVTAVFMPTAAEAGIEYFDIILNDEKIANMSTVVWTDFHITVDKISGDGQVTLSGTPIPGDRLPIVRTSSNNGVGQLDFYGGRWDNDGQFATLFDSDPADPVKIRIILGDRPTQLLIKEWPTVPEPATMCLLGIGGILSLIHRRRRRRV